MLRSRGWLVRSLWQLLIVGGPSFLKDAFKAKFANDFGVTAITLTAGRGQASR